MGKTIKLENWNVAWIYWIKLSFYRYKVWNIGPKIRKFGKFYCWIWEKKFYDYQWRLVISTEKHKKICKTPASESSTKNWKDHCECGYIVTEWGQYGIKLGNMNVKYKGIIMKLRGLETGGLYYLDASQIQHKLGMIAMIYEINDDKKLMDTE